MPRATNAVARKRRKKKVLERAKGYYGRKHSSYRFAKEQVHALGRLRLPRPAPPQARLPPPVDHPDQRRRPREGMSYSEFMHGLEQAGVEVNRKMLADIAVSDPEASADLPSSPGRLPLPSSRQPEPDSPGGREAEPPFFVCQDTDAR